REVLSSLVERWQTGKFPQMGQETGIIYTTGNVEQDSAVYRSVESDLLPALVAEVKPNAGDLYFEYGKDRQLQSRFLLGKIEVARGTPYMRDSEGHERVINASGSTRLTEGTPGTVAVD